MGTVATALIAMGALGVCFGIGLAVASRLLRVHESPKVGRVLHALPGTNCGACGYAGCRAYAEAVVEGEKISLCKAGGQEVAQTIASIMGVEFSEFIPQRAVIHCKGGRSQCPDIVQYVGERDCRAAHITSGGPKACPYGCLGFGSCAEACPFDAITMDENGLPVVDPEKCTACGICVRTCPRDLISLLKMDRTIYLGCSSHDKGKAVKNICEVGCIACGLCEKKDPNEAIKLEDNLPRLDHGKAQSQFSVAAEVCPMDSFVVEGTPAESKQEQEPASARSGS